VVQQVKSSEQTIEEIGAEYLEKQFFTFKRIPPDVDSINQVYMRRQSYDWRDEFMADMGLKWVSR